MKFKVNNGGLIKGLAYSVEVATKNVNKEFISSYHITLDVKKNEIKVIAHGGTAAILSTISGNNIDSLNYSCEEEGEVTINATDLVNSLISFSPSQDIKVETQNGEIIISSETEKDVFQTLPLVKKKVELPSVADSFDKEIKINKEVFVDGLDSVRFAVGFAETQPHYMCICLEASKDKIRFISGTGARFVINSTEGKNIIKVDGKIRMLIPNTNIPSIINILREDSSNDIYIKQAKQSKQSPEQIVIQSDEMMLVLLGIDSGLKYPDTDIVLKHKYPYQLETEISDWKYNVQGISATFNAEMKSENIIHCVDVSADFKKNQLIMETKGQMKSKRRLPFTSISKNGDEETPSFRCNSLYLKEVSEKGEKSDKVTLEFDSEPKPIVIRFADRLNDSKKTTDKFIMFFVKTK